MRRYSCPKCNTIGWKITIRQNEGEVLKKLSEIACLNCGYEECIQTVFLEPKKNNKVKRI